MYDLTNEASLDQLILWRDEAVSRVDSESFFPIIVVGMNGLVRSFANNQSCYHSSLLTILLCFTGNKLDMKTESTTVNQANILNWCREHTYG